MVLGAEISVWTLLECLHESEVPYRGLVFYQAFIVPTQRRHEQQAVNTLETVDPLLTLGTLSSHVKHVVCQLTQIEECLGNAGGSEA